MRGNILIIVLILLSLLSMSALYLAREGLWLEKVVALQRDSLQLELFVDEALLKVEKLIQELPVEIAPVDWPYCSAAPCVLSVQEANFFLEQTVEQWLEHSAVSMPLSLSSDEIQTWIIFEHLNTQMDMDTQVMQQYFRTTFLLLNEIAQTQFRMQATWKKTTLNGNMLGASSLSRLAWR